MTTAKLSCKNPSGEVFVIPSKSSAHRNLICAALSDEKTEIICPASSQDITATVRCLNALGAEIEENNSVYYVTPIRKKQKAHLDCGESGSTLRFLTPVAASLGGEITLSGHGRIPSRPMSELVDCLSDNGAKISYGGTLPITTHGGLRSGRFEIQGSVSSQFISGLIFALPLLSGNSVIEITGKPESLPYIEMTLDTVKKFGINAEFEGNEIGICGNQKYTSPEKLTVEGDWSNAAFWLCLGAFSDKGITVSGLKKDSVQGDRAIVGLLREFGANVTEGDGFVKVSRAPLKGIRIDASEIPDLVPVLTVVAAVAQGETIIYNASRLRIKESDRIESTVAMLRALGACAEATADGIRVVGVKSLSGGIVDAYNDHRIVMSAAVAAAVSDAAVEIRGAEAVRKSYGDFFEKYQTLGANAEITEV